MSVLYADVKYILNKIMTKNVFVIAAFLLINVCYAACSNDAQDDDVDDKKNNKANSDVDSDSDSDTDTDIDTDTDTDADADDFVDVGGTITLTDITDGRIFQRDSDGQHDLLIEGTYDGNPSEIQARVLDDGTDNVVLPWTTIDTSLEDGTFSGVLTDIPKGGWYNLEVQIFHSTTAIDRGSNKFGVGILIACTGQSHIDFWFDPAYGTGAPDTNDLTRMYRHEQVLQNGQPWTGWQPVTGMGARVFANKV